MPDRYRIQFNSWSGNMLSFIIHIVQPINLVFVPLPFQPSHSSLCHVFQFSLLTYSYQAKRFPRNSLINKPFSNTSYELNIYYPFLPLHSTTHIVNNLISAAYNLLIFVFFKARHSDSSTHGG